MKPALRYTLVAIGGLVIGALGGTLFSWRYAISTWVPVTDLFVVVQASAWTSASRASENPAAYEDALRAYLSVLDTAIERDSTAVNRRMYAGDKALSLIRLSDIVAKRGAKDEANSLREQAASLCPVYGLAGCNADTLADLVNKLDQRLEHK